MASLSALQTEIENYGFSATAYASRITTWLNEGQRQIARILDLPLRELDQTLTLVNGTNSYALTATFQRLLYVVNDTADYVLEPIPETEYESLDHTERGAPAYYFVSAGTNIVLYPAPGPGNITSTIRVHYVGLPTAMSAAGDTSGYSSDYDYVLRAYALKEAYAAEDDAQMSQFWDSRWKEGLLAMGEDLNYPDNSGPTQVQGSWNF
jgi:hypothetical protein